MPNLNKQTNTEKEQVKEQNVKYQLEKGQLCISCLKKNETKQFSVGMPYHSSQPVYIVGVNSLFSCTEQLQILLRWNKADVA